MQHRRGTPAREDLPAWPHGTAAGPITPNATHAAPAAASLLLPARAGAFNTDIAWGAYEAAIRRWELTLARPAPNPVEPGRGGRPRLAPRFVEWLMGLEDGHVTGTDLALPRTAQLRILGNGVVPQQATHALRLLLVEAAARSSRHDTARTAVAA